MSDGDLNKTPGSDLNCQKKKKKVSGVFSPFTSDPKKQDGIILMSELSQFTLFGPRLEH